MTMTNHKSTAPPSFPESEFATFTDSKFVGAMWECMMLIHTSEVLKKFSRNEIGAWVRKQLNAIGYPLIPVGCTWGIPCSQKTYDEFWKDEDLATVRIADLRVVSELEKEKQK